MDPFPFKIMGGITFGYIAIIALVIFISWKIGKFLGTHLSQTTGLIVGILLIICGFTLFVAIPCIIYSQKNKDKSLDLDFKINNNVNSNINRTSTITKQEENKKYYKFVGKNFRDILVENDLSDYISIFEQNKLTDLKIISELSEDDLEKLGITIMGDRKRIIKIFNMGNNYEKNVEDDIPDEENTYQEESDFTIHNKWKCSNCGNINDVYLLYCKKCGKEFCEEK